MLSIFPSVQPSLLVDWSFYNSKNPKPNRSASLFGRKNRKIFSYFWALIRVFYSTIAMAKPYASQSPCHNLLYIRKNKLAGATSRASTNDNAISPHTPAVSHISTFALTLFLAPAKLVAKYTNADL